MIRPRYLPAAFLLMLGSTSLSSAQISGTDVDSVPNLTKRLADPTGEFAAAQLALEGKEGETALIAATRSANPTVRFHAVQGLQQIMDSPSLYTVLGLAGDLDPEVGEEVGRTLRLSSAAEFPVIERRIGDLPPEVAKELVLRLAGDPKRWMSLFAYVLESGSDAAKARIMAGAGSAIFAYRPDLKGVAMRNSTAEIKVALLVAISHSSTSAADEQFIGKCLEDRNAEVRAAAIEALSGSQNPPADALFALVHDPIPAVRRAALKEMGQVIPRADVVARQAELVSDPDHEISDGSVRILENHVQSYSTMVTLKEEADKVVHRYFRAVDTEKLRARLFRRVEAGDSPVSALLLGFMGDPRAFDALRKQIPEKVDRRQQDNSAFFALAFSDGQRAGPLLLEHIGGLQIDAIRALGLTHYLPAVPPLMKELQRRAANNDGIWIADALAALGDQQASPLLIQLATSKSLPTQTRGNLLWRVGLLGGPGAVDTLLDILDDASLSSIHWQAHAGMQALKDPKSIPELNEAVRVRKGESAREAASTLERLKKSMLGERSMQA